MGPYDDSEPCNCGWCSGRKSDHEPRPDDRDSVIESLQKQLRQLREELAKPQAAAWFWSSVVGLFDEPLGAWVRKTISPDGTVWDAVWVTADRWAVYGPDQTRVAEGPVTSDGHIAKHTADLAAQRAYQLVGGVFKAPTAQDRSRP